jgi:hypothetical protein
MDTDQVATLPRPRKRRSPSPRRPRTNSLPYENATTGKAAIAEMERVLRAFGAGRFGAMDDYDKAEVMVQFTWRNRDVTIRASGKGYAALWLKRHPWSYGMRTARVEYERRALQQGQVSSWSILRDWIKGQITAVETGIMSFEGAFLSTIMLPSGETVLERIEQEAVLPLPPPAH